MRLTRSLSLMLTLIACQGAPELGDGAGPHPLPDQLEGKADNYISTNAREFDLLGTAHARLPEGFEALDVAGQQQALDRAVAQRLSAVARSVQNHVNDVIRDANGGISGDDASFFAYFKRNNATSGAPEVLTEDGLATVPFQMELVGSVYLMSKVAPEANSRRTFSVLVKSWRDDLEETVEVEIRGSESRDAFPRYDALFADGVFDIAVHFGGDYNEDRLDLETARWTVEYLLEDGWKNESVPAFEALTLTSPPFTRELQLEGRTIEVQVYLYHSELDGGGDQSVLTEAVRKSMAQRDVVIYSGHAGGGAGFLLDYHPRFELNDEDFATLPMAEKYQIFVLDGCQTYRTYVDALMENPAKTFANVDIITTVNTTPFSVGYQLIHEFLYWFTLTNADDKHFPVTWKALLRGVNTRTWKDVHYGVHGVDEDPGLNPHASEGIACSPCAADADCGAGGNFCLGYPSGAACGVACAHDTACGEGYRCARLFEDPDYWYLPKQCVRRDYLCGP